MSNVNTAHQRIAQDHGLANRAHRARSCVRSDLECVLGAVHVCAAISSVCWALHADGLHIQLSGCSNDYVHVAGARVSTGH
jgi:hypothetical protein